VRQWLRDWDKVVFNSSEHRRRPDPYFYVFSLPAAELKALTGIQRRTATGPRAADLGIQRIHEESRSEAIREFVRFGYPWSDLSPTRRRSEDYSDLRKPGWLPTAIVVNILAPHDLRGDEGVHTDDLIRLRETESGLSFELPEGFAGPGWNPSGLHPIEVIDGQHRLWAFKDDDQAGRDYELPVVAFHGLDISWQAYLFWTINIKPKRINASLAFDLFPLLRTEDWLERFGLIVYRESRAQELTEAMWSHPESPWHQRINMLGEQKVPGVTQAAWVRSLVASYLRPLDRRGKVGGLFGAPLEPEGPILGWNRAQQAAFIIELWRELSKAIHETDQTWAESLRQTDTQPNSGDPAFSGRFSLLNTDQGVRGVLVASNDLFYVTAEQLRLRDWRLEAVSSAVDEGEVSDAMSDLRKRPAKKFLAELARRLAAFDWRRSSFPELTPEERTAKAALRGSGGYRELRDRLLGELAQGTDRISDASEDVIRRLSPRR